MEKLRSVNTKFWGDPWVEDLRPEEKLLFLYLLTNPHTNMLGIYEISVKRMASDTGLTEERVPKALKEFARVRKAFYMDNYIVLPNFLKNQKMNTNMQKGAVRIYNELPNWLKESISGNALEAFESLSKALESFEKEKGKGKGKRKEEVEVKEPSQKNNLTLMSNSNLTPEDISAAFLKTNDLKNADPNYYFNQVLDWSSANGKMKKDWIAAVRNWARGDLGKGQLKLKSTRPQKFGQEEVRR